MDKKYRLRDLHEYKPYEYSDSSRDARGTKSTDMDNPRPESCLYRMWSNKSEAPKAKTISGVFSSSKDKPLPKLVKALVVC
jgi:hypothetical protein